MKKANAELKAIAADVKKTIKTGFGEVKRGIAEVGEKVDAVDEKVSKSRRGKRRGKYDKETIAFCVAILSAAESNATIKNGLNTRITHDAVFSYNRRELVQRGVSDVAEFTRIIRAHQAREQRRREKSAAHKRPKNGIMRGMKKNAKHALIFAAAIVGGIAAGMRCDASEWVDNSSQTNPRGAAYTVKTYTEGSDPFDAPPSPPHPLILLAISSLR